MHSVEVPSGGWTKFAELPEVWRQCLEQAWQAFRNDSLPIGAAVADASGVIVAVGRNRLAERHEHAPHLSGTPYLTGSPLAHAELNALLQMGYDRPDPRPTLYTTVEPCPLCMGAARMAGVGDVVFAARDVWAGAASMAESVPYIKRQGPTVDGPVATLEEPVVAWQVAAWHGRLSGNDEFSTVFRTAFPRAFAAGAALGESRALRHLVREDAGIEALWDALLFALQGAG